MRNLKKILALVLALVMSLSLMSIAGATEFPDSDQISETYAESVDVLTGLKVFQGNKGEFKPKDNITRAEVANIIYRIVTGDVDGASVGIYADYNKFTDVPNTAWFAGCVNYCANAEYIKGRGNGKFDPYGNVTGYEALAMILRAIGYDKNGEFTGANWQIQTAATARNRGITKNIVEGTLGVAASREMVAEILCQTILVPVADYSLAFGYRTTDAVTGKENETLAYTTFKMEKWDGVVLANEYANLETQSTLGAGQTKLGDKTLNLATTLDDIGEYRYVYVIPQSGTTRYDLVSSKVYGQDQNNTFETTEKKDIGDNTKFTNVTGMTKVASTEQYVNFGPNTDWTSDWRIRYVVTFDVDTTSVDTINASIRRTCSTDNLLLPEYTSDPAITSRVVAGSLGGAYILDNVNNRLTYERVFEVKADIEPSHQHNIERLFSIADRTAANYLVGEVYVGTASVEDISDKISFQQFKDTYINSDDMDNISGNDRGNWLKVIDNDNDNEAEYVLKVIYTFAQVTAVDADGKATLSTKNQALSDGDAINSLTSEPVVCDGELATGNVVYYARIDGKAQTYIPEMVTAKIDSVNRNDKTATTTDDVTYTESEVHEHTFNPELTSGVQNLSSAYTYDMYLDRGGYLAVFTHSPISKYTLLTDGWYNQQRGGVEYAVKAYIDGKQVDTTVTANGPLFISSNSLINNGVLNNNWGAMKALGGDNGALNNGPIVGSVNSRKVLSSVAYISEDGILVPVDRVPVNINNKVVRMIATDENVIPRTAAIYGEAYFTGIGAQSAYDEAAYNTATNTVVDAATGVIVGGSHNGKVEVRALSNTVYYYVYPNANNSGYDVQMYTGYNAAPAVDDRYIEDVYVVGTRATRASNLENNAYYYTADVVVVEMSELYRTGGEQVFIYDIPSVGNAITTERVNLIHANGEKEENVLIDLTNSDTDSFRNYLPAYGKRIQPGLYYMYKTNTDGLYTIKQMGRDDIARNNYSVGWSSTSDATNNYNWFAVTEFNYNGSVGGTNGYDNLNETQTNRAPQFATSDASKLYTLSYDNSTARVATLKAYEAGSKADFVGERVDRTTNITSFEPNYDHKMWEAGQSEFWNQNDLLVAYSGSGATRTVVYAVSFKNISGANYNYAQDVWNSLKPDTVTANGIATAEFYGNDVTFTTVNGIRNAAVSYAAATTGNNTIVLKVDADNAETIGDIILYKNGALEDTTGRITKTLNNRIATITIDPPVAGANVEWRVVVNTSGTSNKTETLVFTQNAANNDLILKEKAGLTEHVMDAGKLKVPDKDMMVDTYINSFEIPTLATVEWTFTPTNGTPFTIKSVDGDWFVSGSGITEEAAQRTNVKTMDKIEAKVTAENGVSTRFYSSVDPITVTLPATVTAYYDAAKTNAVPKATPTTISVAPNTPLWFSVDNLVVGTGTVIIPQPFTVDANVTLNLKVDTDAPSADGKLTYTADGSNNKGLTIKEGALTWSVTSGATETRNGPSITLNFEKTISGAAAATTEDYYVVLSGTGTVAGQVKRIPFTVNCPAVATGANGIGTSGDVKIDIPAGNWNMTIEQKQTVSKQVSFVVVDANTPGTTELTGWTVYADGVAITTKTATLENKADTVLSAITVDGCTVISATAKDKANSGNNAGSVTVANGVATFQNLNSGKDVVITLSVQKNADLTAAKTNAAAQLNSVFGALATPTADQIAAKNTGLTAIEAAAKTDDVTTALNAALAGITNVEGSQITTVKPGDVKPATPNAGGMNVFEVLDAVSSEGVTLVKGDSGKTIVYGTPNKIYNLNNAQDTMSTEVKTALAKLWWGEGNVTTEKVNTIFTDIGNAIRANDGSKFGADQDPVAISYILVNRATQAEDYLPLIIWKNSDGSIKSSVYGETLVDLTNVKF